LNDGRSVFVKAFAGSVWPTAASHTEPRPQLSGTYRWAAWGK